MAMAALFLPDAHGRTGTDREGRKEGRKEPLLLFAQSGTRSEVAAAALKAAA